MTSTRWQRERSAADSAEYIQQFERLQTQGVDLHGEARFMDAVLKPKSTVLDAGCGTARLGSELARRGHTVTAVDLDPVLVAAARRRENITVHEADLATLDLNNIFDAIVAAGNVMVFLAPGTERTVLERFAAHLNPGGLLVTGFATDRVYTLEQFDADLVAAGFAVENRFATWDVRPWNSAADWALTTMRRL